MDSSVLRHRYLDSSSGREVGSISASVFVSDTGEPKGRWTPTPVYQATETVETLQDSQTYTRHEGFIESKPGQYFGIVLQWRSTGGALTKTWKLDDELILYYYVDGRPLPCMRYTILCPGGKNPLPLSGLWPDNDYRYPFKWSSRPGPSRQSLEPSDDFYTSTDADSSVPPPLKDVHDFSSLRITVHLRSREHESPEPNGNDTDQQQSSPMPRNVHNQQGNHVDPTKVQHADLTECVRLDAPLQVTQATLEDVFSGLEDPASSLPFLEFRMYYKNRETLERLGICDPEGAEAPQTNGIDHPRASTSSSDPRNQSQSKSLSPPPSPPLRSTRTDVPRTNGFHDTASTVPAKRRHENVKPYQVDFSPAAESSSSQASSSDLPPPLKQRSSMTAKARAPDDDVEDEEMDRGARIDTLEHQQDTELSPDTSVEANDRVDSGKPRSSVSPDATGPDGETAPSLSPENTLPDMQMDDVPDLPPPVQTNRSAAPEDERSVSPAVKEGDSSQVFEASANQQTTQDSRPPIVEEARATPVELDPPKQENVSPQFPMPSLLQRKGIKLDSPMPSPSGSSIFPSSQQSSAGRPSLAGREDAAFAFLSEEELDIAEPENVAALLAAGFRTKAKFLAQLPILAPSQREKILSKVEDAMEPMDYAVLYTYLCKHCGFQ